MAHGLPTARGGKRLSRHQFSCPRSQPLMMAAMMPNVSMSPVAMPATVVVVAHSHDRWRRDHRRGRDVGWLGRRRRRRRRAPSQGHEAEKAE